MLLSRLIAVFLLVFSTAAFAGSIDLNVSNHAAQLELGYSAFGTAPMQTGAMYTDQGSVLVDTGLIVKGGGEGEDAASGFAGGGGVKALAGRIQQNYATNTAAGIAIGGQVVYTFPAAPSFALSGEYFTAVKITSFGNADRFNQFGIRLEMGPAHAKFFVGYREITFDIIGTGNVSFDKGGYTGVNFSF